MIHYLDSLLNPTCKTDSDCLLLFKNQPTNQLRKTQPNNQNPQITRKTTLVIFLYCRSGVVISQEMIIYLFIIHCFFISYKQISNFISSLYLHLYLSLLMRDNSFIQVVFIVETTELILV